ncbi:hypothetical protein C1I98_37285 [Spongiactinospora gelatinilytica]|uniref:Uncharacterized protein n=1 Tax=Spongiactinospora gelatinilytica TaxID=2666298 RepID=A0A2W2E9M7_9ACTN|nr:hypothetical protein C1I98_37285 [Spongiactinospora gelatinilytica]
MPQPQQAAPPAPLQNATRYLCAGAYLNGRFRDRVLRELLDDRYRAVAPSFGGVDLVPVLAHCLRAERLSVLRDAFITVLLIVSLLVWPAVLFILPWVPLVLLSAPAVRRGPATSKATLLLATGLLLPVFGYLIIMSGVGTGFDTAPGELPSPGALLGPLVIAALPFALAIGYRVMWYLTLSERLKPGFHDGLTDDGIAAHRDRLEYIARAQWGNITLYGAENPFVGAGDVHRSWSIAVELDRLRRPPGRSPGSAGYSGRDDPVRDRQVEIDVVDLHDFVRSRLLQMRDAVRDPAQVIAGLHITDHLAVRGTFTRRDWPDARARTWHGPHNSHPLIDPGSGMPHYAARKDTIDAVSRHPQGGVRHYQRVTVNVDGQDIRNADGFLLAPAEDRGIVVSAFIHLAVEGRMLYTQLVVTVLPPVAAQFHEIDKLPALPKPIVVWRAALSGRNDLVADVVFAPGRLIRTAVQNIRRGIRQRNPARYLVYPFGARESVRELGAAIDVDRFTHVLDADKYTKLIEQRLTEAVLDYLEARDIDTTAYRQQAATVINNGAIITGGTVTGPVAAGAHAQARQQQHQHQQQQGQPQPGSAN